MTMRLLLLAGSLVAVNSFNYSPMKINCVRDRAKLVSSTTTSSRKTSLNLSKAGPKHSSTSLYATSDVATLRSKAQRKNILQRFWHSIVAFLNGISESMRRFFSHFQKMQNSKSSRDNSSDTKASSLSSYAEATSSLVELDMKPQLLPEASLPPLPEMSKEATEDIQKELMSLTEARMIVEKKLKELKNNAAKAGVAASSEEVVLLPVPQEKTTPLITSSASQSSVESPPNVLAVPTSDASVDAFTAASVVESVSAPAMTTTMTHEPVETVHSPDLADQLEKFGNTMETEISARVQSFASMLDSFWGKSRDKIVAQVNDLTPVVEMDAKKDEGESGKPPLRVVGTVDAITLKTIDIPVPEYMKKQYGPVDPFSSM